MPSKPFALLAAAALGALLAGGCAKNTDQSTSTTSTTSTTTAAPAATTPAMSNVAATGDAAHGKTIFATNCAQCHGATGTGGNGFPSLKNEKSRKNFAQTVAWIKNPTAPMPKLFPDPLKEKDVNDVAAFVQTL